MQAPYNNPQYSYQMPQKPNTGAPVLGLMTVGALGGGTVGYLRNRTMISDDGKINDSFAKKVYENISKIDSNDNKTYKQCCAIADKIDKVKNKLELKKLFDKNKDGAEALFQGKKEKVEKFLETVTSDNIKATKEKIKQGINAINDMYIQSSKNIITKCWDKDLKEFVKPDKMDSRIFDAVKNTKTTQAWKKACKYGGITAIILGGAAIAYNFITQPRIR